MSEEDRVAEAIRRSLAVMSEEERLAEAIRLSKPRNPRHFDTIEGGR